MHDPKEMTEKERIEEICTILANGITRVPFKPKEDIAPRKRGGPKKESA